MSKGQVFVLLFDPIRLLAAGFGGWPLFLCLTSPEVKV